MSDIGGMPRLNAFPAAISAALLLTAACVSPPPDLSKPAVGSGAGWAEACEPWDEWDKPGPPYRLHGDSYYVGTCGIAAVLIAGSAGHVLIDGGTATGADLIAANIEALGFDLQDVDILLVSHEHFDHAGGIAALQKRTGARLLASAAAAPVLETGEASPDDPQYGMLAPFPAARVDAVIGDGALVGLGDIAIRVIATPGHTPGALSYQWKSCAPDGCETIVYADSLSPVSGDDYRFSDDPEYVDAYRAGLARLAALGDCTLLVTPHPSASGLRKRLLSGGLRAGDGCRAYAEGLVSRLDERLAAEAGAGSD